MEPHGHGMAADILTSEVANARQRIIRAEIALERTAEMLAENVGLCGKMRCLVEAADHLVRIDPPS